MRSPVYACGQGTHTGIHETAFPTRGARGVCAAACLAPALLGLHSALTDLKRLQLCDALALQVEDVIQLGRTRVPAAACVQTLNLVKHCLCSQDNCRRYELATGLQLEVLAELLQRGRGQFKPHRALGFGVASLRLLSC